MKFGKQLLSQQRPAWARYYLDYKALKKIIAGKIPPGAAPASATPPAAPDSPEGTRRAFFDALNREVDKINSFYLQEQRAITDRVHALAAIRAALASAAVAPASLPDTLPTGGNLRVKLGVSSDQGAASSPHTHAASSDDAAEDSLRPLPLPLLSTSPTIRALREGWAAVLVALARLEQFVELNATGLRKILKKWDKRAKSQVRELYLARQLDIQPCFDRTHIASLAAAASSQLASLVVYPNAARPQEPLAQAEQDLAHFLKEQRLDDAAALFHPHVEGKGAPQEYVHQGPEEKRKERCVEATLWRVLWDHLSTAGPSTNSILAGILYHPSACSNAPATAAQVLAEIAFSRQDDINDRRGLHMAAGAGLDTIPPQDRSADLLRAGLAYVTRHAGSEQEEKDEAMLQATRTVDAYNRDPLGYVAARGCASAIGVLLPYMRLGAGSSPPAPDTALASALQLAVQGDHVEVVRQLLRPDDQRSLLLLTDLSQPLTLAAERGRADILPLLLPHPKDLPDAAPALSAAALAAARASSTDCLLILLDVGASTEGRDAVRDSWTPLFFTAEQGNADATQGLLLHGANPLAQDEKGRLPSFYAAWEGKIKVAQILLEAEHKALLPLASTNVSSKQSGKKMEFAVPENANTTGSGSEAAPALSLEGCDDMPELNLDAPAHDQTSGQGDPETIPSLALPPPILPFRTYGASYLGDLGDGSPEQALVSLTLSPQSISLGPVRISLPPSPSLPPVPSPVPQYKQPRQLVSSSSTSSPHGVFAALPLPLKLTLSASTSNLSVPWNIPLPLSQTERIALRFTSTTKSSRKGQGVHLEFHLSTAFGRTVFARAVLDESSGLDGAVEPKVLTVPLEDVANGYGDVGHLSVEVQVVTPFSFEPKLGHPSDPTGSQAAHQDVQSSNLGGAQDSAAASTNSITASGPSGSIGDTMSPPQSASSMPGRYLRVAVRVVQGETGPQVLAGPWHGPLSSPLTRLQLAALAPVLDGDELSGWVKALESHTTALDDLLAVLPASVGVAVHVLSIPAELDANASVDAILRAVYLLNSRTPAIQSGEKHLQEKWAQSKDLSSEGLHDGGAENEGARLRNLIFSSDLPAVCTALNWKQPNYAVLFSAAFGADPNIQDALLPRRQEHRAGEIRDADIPSHQSKELRHSQSNAEDPRCASISEAVRFARDDNLLGLVVPHPLARAVPALVPAIQGAGLLAVLQMGMDSSTNSTSTTSAASIPALEGTKGRSVPDGIASGSILVCKPPQNV